MQRGTVYVLMMVGTVIARSSPEEFLHAEPDVQRGNASFYDPERFRGRPMANGDRFDPESNVEPARPCPWVQSQMSPIERPARHGA